MIYVGIDVAKDKHDCAIIDDKGEVIAKSFLIKNSLEGFTTLIQRIDHITSNRSEVEIGLESTGHYSGNIVNYLSNLFMVKTINPLLTAKQKKAKTLRMVMSSLKCTTRQAKLYSRAPNHMRNSVKQKCIMRQIGNAQRAKQKCTTSQMAD